MREAAGWVKNLTREPAVRFRVGTRDDIGETTCATTRIVGEPDLLAEVAAKMDAKYGWSDGLVIEIAPQCDALGGATRSSRP